jgi:hypothetical protein
MPLALSADASSAAAVDLPLHGTPHMITRHPLTGAIVSSTLSTCRICLLAGPITYRATLGSAV